MAYTADQRNDVLETWWKPYWKSRHWARGIPRWCYHSKIQEVLLFSLSKSKTFRAVFFQDPDWHNSDETPVCAGDLVKGKAGEHGIKDHCLHRWSWLRVLCETFKPIIIKHKKANETFTSKFSLLYSEQPLQVIRMHDCLWIRKEQTIPLNSTGTVTATWSTAASSI